MAEQDEFTFRGKTLDELKDMELEEFADLLNSRGRRKIQRGLREEEEKILETLEEKDRAKTHRRGMIVVPQMVGKTIEVYNGQRFIEVEIAPEMLGHYLGEFARTRKEVEHSAPGLGATRSSKHIPLK
ncbi:30S ribosomal protein S19 [Candidatus Nanohalovita haloferacivicina]|uniref:30S ribosomal protein S19 n=1 Tax=Candidatus Nanohalovita haloferacivicina TaxID=2978046 RepID=UPI00325F9733|nr:Ribosomal protein S19 [Candidatus Nanohalobia archaeon BNXNv]